MSHPLRLRDLADAELGHQPVNDRLLSETVASRQPATAAPDQPCVAISEAGDRPDVDAQTDIPISASVFWLDWMARVLRTPAPQSDAAAPN